MAASLPGGDPLAAALAAGETPSPDMLAAAGETEALGVGWGVAAVAAVVVGLLVFAGLSAQTSIVGRVPFDKGPDVLIDRAERMIASLGYPGAPGDQASGFSTAGDYTGWLWRTRSGPTRWDSISIGNPPAVLFWYRTSPREMVPIVPPRVRPGDPPLIQTDMRLLVLDVRGRLREFRSVPPQVDAADGPPSRSRDGTTCSRRPGCELSAFSPVAPTWLPRDYADVRAAWEGPLPEQPDLRVRVEAAGYRGKPVWFSIVGPWTQPTLMSPRQSSVVDRVINGAVAALSILLVVTAMLLARRHLRANRADRPCPAAASRAVRVLATGPWLWNARRRARGPGWLISAWLGWGTTALEMSLVAVFLFVILRLLLRRLWLSVIVGGLFLSLLSLGNAGTTNTLMVVIFVVASAALHTMILVRFGLLPFAVSVFARSVMTGVPLSLDVTQWWAAPSNWTLALLMALTLFGFYASRAGQPLLGRVLSE